MIVRPLFLTSHACNAQYAVYEYMVNYLYVYFTTLTNNTTYLHNLVLKYIFKNQRDKE